VSALEIKSLLERPETPRAKMRSNSEREYRGGGSVGEVARPKVTAGATANEHGNDSLFHTAVEKFP